MPRSKIIVFSGIDGSGKTTLASFANEKLAKKYKTVYLHTNKNLLRKKKSSGDKIAGKISLLSASVIGLKDLVKILWFVGRNYFVCDFLICDRYIQDIIAKVRYRRGESNILEKLLYWLSPTPLAVFYISVPSVVSYQRDDDHTKEYHQRKKEIYDSLYQKTDKKVIILDGSQDLSDVKKDLINHLVEIS